MEDDQDEVGKIVPIGKYKGQPLERLLSDQPYSEWLLAQAWFLDRYADLAQLMRMGRLSEPQDTPEHNAMVARLIDQRDVFEYLFSRLFPGIEWDDPRIRKYNQEIEPRGGDLLVSVNTYCRILIEVKPLIGDDYPSVIRQLKAGRKNYSTRPRAVVVANKVEPTNLTLDQVRRQFELSGLFLILEHELFSATGRRP